MKTVVISGYYGYGNTGDEALLASITASLKAMLPGLRIIVLSAKPEKTARQYGVEAVDRLSLSAVFSVLKKADLLISGGGSLLQDVTGPLTIPYYLGVVAIAKLLGKKVMFYAQGIGPINGFAGKVLVKLIANRADIITLRDTASLDLLRRLGVSKPYIEVTADPVFASDIEDKMKACSIPAEQGKIFSDKPVVGIFIREWQGLIGYKKAIAGLADYLLENGREVVFIPMQSPSDVAPSVEIAAMMEHEPVIIKQGFTFDQLICMVKPMEMVVGMRLHALIISALCSVPMIGLSYDPKVYEFLAEIKQPVFDDLSSVNKEQLIQSAEKVLQNLKEIRTELDIIRSRLRQKALVNAEYAIKILVSPP